MMMRAPRLAKSLTVSSPRPLLPPVMSTVFPVIFSYETSSQQSFGHTKNVLKNSHWTQTFQLSIEAKRAMSKSQLPQQTKN
jgi:hypothetical protein